MMQLGDSSLPLRYTWVMYVQMTEHLAENRPTNVLWIRNCRHVWVLSTYKLHMQQRAAGGRSRCCISVRPPWPPSLCWFNYQRHLNWYIFFDQDTYRYSIILVLVDLLLVGAMLFAKRPKAPSFQIGSGLWMKSDSIVLRSSINGVGFLIRRHAFKMAGGGRALIQQRPPAARCRICSL